MRKSLSDVKYVEYLLNKHYFLSKYHQMIRTLKIRYKY